MDTQKSDVVVDEYKIKLEDSSKILLDCQRDRGFNSCFECGIVLGCNVRNRYVKAVYESMSHGKSGGFEF